MKTLFKEFIKEELQQINNNSIGVLITSSILFISQIHMWHLLCDSGQKHTALGDLYKELQDEVDKLAEKYLAQGGELIHASNSLIAEYDEFSTYERIQAYRRKVSASIKELSEDQEMQSIVDSLIDIQEIIDSTLYKFNLK